MDINNFEPEIVALIEEIYSQKRDMSKEVLNTIPRLLEIAEEQGDKRLQGFAHFHLADSLYAFEVDYDGLRRHLAKAIFYLNQVGEKELLARAYNYVAIDALNNGSNDVCYLYLMNALQTCEDIDNDYLKCIINNNIGQVFARMHSFEKAVKYVRKSNELQALCNKDDFYYNQNMINGYFSEGILHALMGDIEGAKEADAKIAALEKETDLSLMKSVFIPILLLRLMIAVMEGDNEDADSKSRELIKKLKESHRIYDFITDIEDLCRFLIENGYLDTAKEIVDIIKTTVESTNVVLMKKIISSIEIAYYEKNGDAAKLNEHLLEQYRLSEQQQMEQNRIYQYSIDLIDIMEEQRREQEKVRLENEHLHSQVQTDPLTGIPNRLMLDELIPTLFEQAQNDETLFGVALMDIDKFKEYNDTYGHLAGDICLQKVAKAIERVSGKPGVYCARYGGDEFIMLYSCKSDEEIMSIADELNKEIFALDIEHSAMGEGGRISISQGICNSTPQKENVQEDFMNEADNALYAIKKRLGLRITGDSVRLVHLNN